MDASFDPTYYGNGWGDADTSASAPVFKPSHNEFEKVPLPVQIVDVLNNQSDDDKIHLGIYSFGMLRVCGRILNKDEKEKEVHLLICDPQETDQDNCEKLSVVVYRNQNADESDYNEGDIVIALGKIRKFGTEMSVVAFGIVKVDNEQMAEVFKLEADLANRYYSQNIPERISQGECPEFEGTMFSNLPITREPRDNAMNGTQNNGYGASQVVPKVEYSQGGDNRGLSGTKNQIFEIIRNNASAGGSSGIHVSDIRSKLGQNVPTFDSDLQYLVNEGIIYNTIDDDHFDAI